METSSRSERIKKRFIEVSQNNELYTSDEIQIIEYLFKRLNLLTITEAAKRSKVSYNGMKKRVETGKEMNLKVGDITLVSC